jgi:hypothetical protein
VGGVETRVDAGDLGMLINGSHVICRHTSPILEVKATC